MEVTFRFIEKENILCILPLVQKLGNFSVEVPILKQRILEMAQQNYECVGVYDAEKLIGCCGLWFQTRHYAGRSVEMDQVFIDEAYRSQGLGAKLLDFVYEYAHSKKCRWVELNTYVHNFPSHKFYYKHGFVAKGYHFVKEL